jgi:hypothetical protein
VSKQQDFDEAVVGGSRNCPRNVAVVSILLHQIPFVLFKLYEVLLMLCLHHVLACKSQLMLWARCCCKLVTEDHRHSVPVLSDRIAVFVSVRAGADNIKKDLVPELINKCCLSIVHNKNHPKAAAGLTCNGCTASRMMLTLEVAWQCCRLG